MLYKVFYKRFLCLDAYIPHFRVVVVTPKPFRVFHDWVALKHFSLSDVSFRVIGRASCLTGLRFIFQLSEHELWSCVISDCWII